MSARAHFSINKSSHRSLHGHGFQLALEQTDGDWPCGTRKASARTTLRVASEALP